MLSVLADTEQVSDLGTQLHIRQWQSWNGDVVLATKGRTAGKDQQKSQTLLVVPQHQRELLWRKAQVTFCLNFGMRSHVWFLVLSSNHYGFYWAQLLAGTKAMWKTLRWGNNNQALAGLIQRISWRITEEWAAEHWLEMPAGYSWFQKIFGLRP